MKAAARSAATLHRTGNFKSRGQCGESGAISGSFLARGKASEMAVSEKKNGTPLFFSEKLLESTARRELNAEL
jgi:hypothetical protein